MKNIKHDIDALEEQWLVHRYVEHSNSKDIKMSLEEYPISVNHKKRLLKHQSIPDAIIKIETERKFLEVTTFSMSEKMRKDIGEMRKYPSRFEGQTILPPSKISCIDSELYQTIAKKLDKNYGPFTDLAGVNLRGILVVYLVENTPFMNEQIFRYLLERLGDNHVLYSWGIDQGDFDQIDIGAYVQCQDGQWRLIFETFVDVHTLTSLRLRRARMAEMGR